MTETMNVPPAEGGPAVTGKRPGMVIFVAILHFLTVAFFSFLSFICIAAMLFGAALGTDNYFTQQVSRFSPPNSSHGLTIVLGMALFVLLCFVAFFLTLAVGLLKGKKFAWYQQVAFSTFSLLAPPLAPLFFLWALPVLPVGFILNIVILIFFFRPRLRGYFKV